MFEQTADVYARYFEQVQWGENEDREAPDLNYNTDSAAVDLESPPAPPSEATQSPATPSEGFDPAVQPDHLLAP
eukprot:3168741-Alexandrium_andersonii.AAC.1